MAANAVYPVTSSGGGITRDTYANILATGSPTTGQLARPTDGGELLMYDGSNWRPQLDGFEGDLCPDPSGWTWVNQGTGLASRTNGRILATKGPTDNAVALAVTSNSNGISGFVRHINPGAAAGLGVAEAGVVVRESATGKWAGILRANVTNATSATEWGAGYVIAYGTESGGIPSIVPAYYSNVDALPMRMTYSGANLLWQVCMDPASNTWTTVYTSALTTIFTVTFNQAGIGLYDYNVPGAANVNVAFRSLKLL